MIEQELNKKLAEWVGIKWRITERTDNHLEQDIWIHPDGTIKDEPPNFTQSLDACFKWLVPKLDRMNIEYDCGSVEPFWCRVDGEYTTIAQEPALALCLAIEKLIGEEK